MPPTSPPLACPATRFSGAYDIRRAVDAAAQQRVLHPMVLGAIATTLGAAARLQARLNSHEAGHDGSREHALPALRELGAGIGDALPQLRQAIEQCIQVGALGQPNPAVQRSRASRPAPALAGLRCRPPPP